MQPKTYEASMTPVPRTQWLRDRARQVVVTLSVLAGIGLNALLYSRRSPSATTHTLVDAAPYAFSIWALIFASWIAYAVYQWMPLERERSVHRSIGWRVALNALLSGAWVFAVNAQRPVIGAAIVALTLVNLALIERRLGAYVSLLRRSDALLLRAPMRLNLGWISVATIIITASVLRGHVGWRGEPLDEAFWSISVLAVAAALSMWMVLRRSAVAYGLAVAWGAVGIAVEQSRAAPPLTVAALIVAAMIGASIGLRAAMRPTRSGYAHTVAA